MTKSPKKPRRARRETTTRLRPPTQAPISATTSNTTGTTASASILPQGSVWQRGQPMAQPLGYRTAVNATGGERVMTYGYTVDFNSRESVAAANKSRRREVWRARTKFGLPLPREDFNGNRYMPAHYDWIAIAHEA